MYADMIRRIGFDERGRRRAELDRQLGVSGWARPGAEWNRDVDVTAPAWWHGDEDASQSFLATMGVRLDGGG